MGSITPSVGDIITITNKIVGFPHSQIYRSRGPQFMALNYTGIQSTMGMQCIVSYGMQLDEGFRRRSTHHGVCSWLSTSAKLWPIGSMYGIYGNIYHQYTPNVSIYTIHGSYGWYHWIVDMERTSKQSVNLREAFCVSSCRKSCGPTSADHWNFFQKHQTRNSSSFIPSNLRGMVI